MKFMRQVSTRLAPCRAMAMLWSAGCAVVLLTACATHTEPLIHRVQVGVTREAPVNATRIVATEVEVTSQAPVEVIREVPVDVTRIVPREVEVVREVPVEVTRIVPREVLVTPTPRPRQRLVTSTPRPMPTPTTASAPALPTGSLVIALTQMGFNDPVPWKSGLPGIGSLRFIYDPLLGTDRGGSVVGPGLAESWDISEDGREWTFNLRQGIRFHHGQELSAEDIVLSINKRLQEGPIGHFDASLGAPEIIDDHTFSFLASSPASPSLWDFTDTLLPFAFAVPADHYRRVGDQEFAQSPVGTGPYRHIEHLRGERLVLEAVQRHWREGVPTKHLVRFLVVQDENSKIAALKTGQVDIIGPVYDNYDVGESGFQVFWREGWTTVGFRIHQQWDDVPIADVRVRQALNYAIDRVHLADALLGGWARPAAVPIRMPDRDPYWDLEPYPYDPDKARELLAEAGYPDGFALAMHVYNDRQATYGVDMVGIDLAELLHGFFGEIGVAAEINVSHYRVIRARIVEQDIPGHVSYRTFPNRRTPWIVRNLGFLFHSTSRFTITKDPELDWLIEQSINEPDPFKQEALVNELLWRTHKNANYIPLLHVDIPYAASDKVPADWDLGSATHYPDYLDVVRRR